MNHPIALLVVDDDAVDRLAVRRALRAGGVEAVVTEAEDSATALAALSTGAFDCVLLDYRLPGGDGLAVLRALRNAGARVPVVMLTGQGDEQLAVEIMKAGAADYLVKGKLSPEMLARSIRHAMRVHRIEAQAAEAESHRRYAEAALRQNERLLAITLRSIGDAVIATDSHGRVTFMNAVAEDLAGWSARDAVGRPIDEVLPLGVGERVDPIESPVPTVLATGAVVPLRDGTRARTRSGALSIAGSGAPIRDDHGAVVGVVMVFRDMTEQVRAEGRLRFLAEVSKLLAASLDHQAQLTSLVRLAVPGFAESCAVDIVQPDGVLQRVAQAVDEPLARGLAVAGDDHAPPGPQASIGPGRVAQSGRLEFCPLVTAQLLADMPEAERRTIAAVGLASYISVPLATRDGLLGAITFARSDPMRGYTAEDVTLAEEVGRRAALAIDNAELYRRAHDAIRTRDAFLSVAAHELKTPLTSLLGYADLVQRRAAQGATLGERELRGLRVLVEQARRLNKMVTSLLDLSRLQTGQLDIERRPLDLTLLARRIAEEVEPTMTHHTLHVEIPDEPLVVSGDELRLGQVAQNLLQNAIKYSPAGGPVYLRVTRQDDSAVLSVRDEGVGIPRESLAHIFGRFYRAANTGPYEVSGMGVGLYVVKQVVELHGGEVTVESTEGVGSTFTVRLPIGVPAELPPSAAEPQLPQRAA